MKQKSALVVGGDSFLGRELIDVLNQNNIRVIETTRHLHSIAPNRIYLDLTSDDFLFSENFDYAFLLAGVWNYQECEMNPDAWKVNVTNMALLAKSLLESNTFVSFISSNTVFGGNQAWCNEDDKHEPRFVYAQHKSAGETAIKLAANKLGKEERLNIIRLTKIMDITTPPLPLWLDDVSESKPITPFSDLIFSPISLDYAAENVCRIGLSATSGNFHLSGASNLNYFDFSILLLKKFNFAPTLSSEVTSIRKGVNIPFKPKYSGLGMKATTERLGIKPQTIDSLLTDLSNQYTTLNIGN